MRYIKDTAGSGKFAAILAILPLLAPPAADAATYKWRDADGNVVYSQIPPPDGRATQRLKPPPPPPEPAAAGKQLQDLRQRLEDHREDRGLDADKAREQARQKEVQRQNCEHARNNLQQLEQKNRPLVSDSRGGMRRMSAQERQKKLAQYRADVKKYCQ